MTDNDSKIKMLKDIKRSLEDAPIPDWETIDKVDKKIRNLELFNRLEKAGVPVSEIFKRLFDDND